jgi:hypothetical protein
MAALRHIATASITTGPMLTAVASYPRLRALAWCGNDLYGSRGYELVRARIDDSAVVWSSVARYQPVWWRRLTSSSRLAFRAMRDGFHALAVLSSGHMVAAVPGAIVTLLPQETQFRISHRMLRGTRPLHIAATPDDRLFWGEYFDNPQRAELHIYTSNDRGVTWEVAYTFSKGAIRHVHNIIHDPWENCLWILTGDDGSECRILKASCDLRHVEVVLSGNQQARAVAMVPTRDGVFFSSDTPFEANHVYFLDRQGNLARVADLTSSSIYGCRAGESVFFSTMVEPSSVNLERTVNVFGSADGKQWQSVLSWSKDGWPLGLFQYGNAFLPDGNNTSGLLAMSTIAVAKGDLETGLWRVNSAHVL